MSKELYMQAIQFVQNQYEQKIIDSDSAVSTLHNVCLEICVDMDLDDEDSVFLINEATQIMHSIGVSENKATFFICETVKKAYELLNI